MVDGDGCKTCLPGEVFLLLAATKLQLIIKVRSVKKPYSKGKLPRSA